MAECLLCFCLNTNAQYWNLTGNADATSTSFLGTTVRQPLTIKTSGVVRATFNAGGGLILATPMKFSAQTQGITFSATTSTNVPMIQMFASGTTNADRMVIAHSAAFPTWGLQYQDNGDKFNFLNAGANVMTVDLANKRVGIGTSSPSYPLHVTGSGTTAYVTSSFLNPDGYAMYVYYDGIINNFGSRALFAKARSGNNTATAIYTESDFIGVDAHTTAGSSGGYGLSGVATGNGSTFSYGVYGRANNDYLNYGVYGTASGGTYNYAVYAAGTLAYTGSLTHVSDEKLKENIQPLTKAIEKIMMLKPKTYNFKNNDYSFMNLPRGKQFGLVSQDVQKVFPELVSQQSFPPQYDMNHKKIHDAVEYLGLNSEDLIPVIIAAMQEQQQQINQKDEQLQSLQKQLDDLKNQVLVLSQSKSLALTNQSVNPARNNIYLDQNTPNPAKNNTIISYRLPAAVQHAAIAVYDVNGKQMKYVSLTNNNGNITVSTAGMSAGSYVYSLVVNNNIIESRSMQVSK